MIRAWIAFFAFLLPLRAGFIPGIDTGGGGFSGSSAATATAGVQDAGGSAVGETNIAPSAIINFGNQSTGGGLGFAGWSKATQLAAIGGAALVAIVFFKGRK